MYISIILLLSLIIIYQFIKSLSQTFKISYYETTFKNNKHQIANVLSYRRYEQIEDVMNDFWKFLK